MPTLYYVERVSNIATSESQTLLVNRYKNNTLNTYTLYDYYSIQFNVFKLQYYYL